MLVVLVSILIFIAGYRFYSSFLSRQMGLDDSRQTPACEINDGLDFVPASPALLLGQHFSVIAAFLILTKEKGYLVAWPVFGTSNQLLASLTLLSISIWLIKSGKSAVYTIVPMTFMMAMTLWSLMLLILPFFKQGIALNPDALISSISGIILLGLALLLILEAIKALLLRAGNKKAKFTLN